MVAEVQPRIEKSRRLIVFAYLDAAAVAGATAM
jgi:hypothetical protein